MPLKTLGPLQNTVTQRAVLRNTISQCGVGMQRPAQPQLPASICTGQMGKIAGNGAHKNIII